MGFDYTSSRTANIGGSINYDPYYSNHFGAVKVPAEVRGNFVIFENPTYFLEFCQHCIDLGPKTTIFYIL